MPSEVERLKKEITSLEAKRADHTRKHTEAVHRRAELESHRQTLLEKVADNDQGARRELRTLDGRRLELDEDEAAYSAATTNAEGQLVKLRADLARAERTAAITALEHQITLLTPADNELEAAIAVVKSRSDALSAAVANVAQELERLDATRFDSAFRYKLAALIPETIYHRLQEMSFPNAERSASFVERARARLENAMKQLRYLSEAVVPARGEQLFRCRSRVQGLRGLDLLPNDVIALRPDEAQPFVAGGSVELVVAAESEQAA